MKYKFEVLVINDQYYIPGKDAITTYDLINKVMAKTRTCCYQTPGQYELRQTHPHMSYKQEKDFKIQGDLVLDVLKENGYNVNTLNSTGLPETILIWK